MKISRYNGNSTVELAMPIIITLKLQMPNGCLCIDKDIFNQVKF